MQSDVFKNTHSHLSRKLKEACNDGQWLSSKSMQPVFEHAQKYKTPDQLLSSCISISVNYFENKVNFIIAMPQTSSERSRNFRKKLKDNSKLHESYKTKDRERKKGERRRPKFQSAAEIAQQRKFNQDRVRKHRRLRKKRER